MRRGFKTQAEKEANAIRQRLRLGLSDPLQSDVLAMDLNVQVLSVRSIPHATAEILYQLLEADRLSWSAFTVAPDKAKTFIFYNPTHSKGRHESNVLHELSHLLCKHEPSKFMVIGGCSFSLCTCNPEQEEEATWFCGCLKLPHGSLLWAVGQRMTNRQIAEHFITNADMVSFRRNVTGVDKQMAWSRGKRQAKG